MGPSGTRGRSVSTAAALKAAPHKGVDHDTQPGKLPQPGQGHQPGHDGHVVVEGVAAGWPAQAADIVDQGVGHAGQPLICLIGNGVIQPLVPVGGRNGGQLGAYQKHHRVSVNPLHRRAVHLGGVIHIPGHLAHSHHLRPSEIGHLFNVPCHDTRILRQGRFLRRDLVFRVVVKVLLKVVIGRPNGHANRKILHPLLKYIPEAPQAALGECHLLLIHPG